MPRVVVEQRDAHLTLAFTAPEAVLLTATEVNEWVWEHAIRLVTGVESSPMLSPGDLPRDEAAAVNQLRHLAALERLAPTSDIALTAGVHQHVALVTGSNGKTTTTRLIAAMTTAFGWRSGWSCTDGVFIAGETVESGDWSGPAGARRVVSDPSVEAAVLETARGGILRRGLGVIGADVAVVTNIEEDHFGEYGVRSLADLAVVKLTTAKGLRPGGQLLLNAADPTLRAAPLPPNTIIDWFAPAGREGDTADLPIGAWRDSDALWLEDAQGRHHLGDLRAMPLTLGGTARYNIANALAAALAANRLGVDAMTIAHVLKSFGAHPGDNAGRLMRFSVDGAEVLLDYAHNPTGLQGLLGVAQALAPKRLLLLLGQAGNRSDDALTALAETAWAARPDRIILKDLEGYRRGRDVGEVPALLAAALGRAGAPAERLTVVPDEVEAVEAALAWAEPGDVLVLPVHGLEAREAVLTRLAARGIRL